MYIGGGTSVAEWLRSFTIDHKLDTIKIELLSDTILSQVLKFADAYTHGMGLTCQLHLINSGSRDNSLNMSLPFTENGHIVLP